MTTPPKPHVGRAGRSWLTTITSPGRHPAHGDDETTYRWDSWEAAMLAVPAVAAEHQARADRRDARLRVAWAGLNARATAAPDPMPTPMEPPC